VSTALKILESPWIGRKNSRTGKSLKISRSSWKSWN
jgi:hypothetical protein